jgi:hypothetical protein
MARVLIASLGASSAVTPAIAAAKDVFRRGGMTVIEQAVPLTLARGQGPQLPEQAVLDARWLAFGKEAGADHVILIDVTDTLVLEKSGRTMTGYLHDEQVTVRGVGVDSGAMVLEGSARWSQPVERPGQHLRQLTVYAIARALCPPNKWEEASALNKGRGKCRS